MREHIHSAPPAQALAVARRAPWSPALPGSQAQLAISGAAAAAALLSALVHPGAPRAVGMLLAVGGAAFVGSTAGFAFSALAGAVVWHLSATPAEAVATLLCCSIALQLHSVAGLWREIEWRRLPRFVGGGLLTLLPSCWLVLHAPTAAYRGALGALLLAYAAWMLLRRPAVVRVGPRAAALLDVLAGAAGGVTGPLAAFPSVAVTAWCSLRGWDRVRQRALYQPYILAMQLAAVVALSALRGRACFAPSTLVYLAPTLLGCHLGMHAFRRMSDARFLRVVYGLLAVSGLSLLLR